MRRRTGITTIEAERILRDDLRSAEDPVNRHVRVPLTQNQFDALTSLTFNIGAGKFEGSTLLRLLNMGDYRGAQKEFIAWHFGGPGLLPRREWEATLFSRR